MKKSPSQYRLLTGIKSDRSNQNPISIKKKNPAVTEAAHHQVVEHPLKAEHPEVVEHALKAEQYDKDYAFNYIQSRWFSRSLRFGEQLTMTADHLKMICDEVHEIGRLLERKKNASDRPPGH